MPDDEQDEEEKWILEKSYLALISITIEEHLIYEHVNVFHSIVIRGVVCSTRAKPLQLITYTTRPDLMWQKESTKFIVVLKIRTCK